METGGERSAAATSWDIDLARMLAAPVHLLFTFDAAAALVLAFLVLAVPLVRLLGLTLVLTLRTVFLA